ncbi:Cysteine-rich secretory protein family protein [Yoonia maricola]|uniref:Cysteine-rich secretory protein family protein n=1 Tax=Yoonia maricola TaxID=420999 RepID=A0A2M8W4K1_9RHOB|nr:CAP domain-containing protein [Yoonia maricola]PJI85840.1 Cysteine-rich secretory protein family protein [Yoonia maricola]
MLRRDLFLGLAALGLTACGSTSNRPLGPDGLPLPSAYVIQSGDEAAIQFRMLDSVNALRQTAGAEPVTLDARLNAAAATHARDMAVQNRPWLFGSDGSSPVERARRVGFPGRLLGENISESFESELQTLGAWMAQPDTRAVILDPNARFMGFAWYQEESAKLWWTLNMGSDPAVSQPIAGRGF